VEGVTDDSLCPNFGASHLSRVSPGPSSVTQGYCFIPSVYRETVLNPFPGSGGSLTPSPFPFAAVTGHASRPMPGTVRFACHGL